MDQDSSCLNQDFIKNDAVGCVAWRLVCEQDGELAGRAGETRECIEDAVTNLRRAHGFVPARVLPYPIHQPVGWRGFDTTLWLIMRVPAGSCCLCWLCCRNHLFPFAEQRLVREDQKSVCSCLEIGWTTINPWPFHKSSLYLLMA